MKIRVEEREGVEGLGMREEEERRERERVVGEESGREDERSEMPGN